MQIVDSYSKTTLSSVCSHNLNFEKHSKIFRKHCYSTKSNGANNWFLVILNCHLVVTVVFTLCSDWLIANDFTHHLSNRRSLHEE